MKVLRNSLKAKVGLVIAVLASLSLVVPAFTAAAAPLVRSRSVAHSTLIRGTVVARGLRRHTLVISAPNGTVRTLRLTSARKARSTALGTSIFARSIRLGDGTYRVLGVKKFGHAKKARIRATVVRSLTSRTVLSGGGSVFSIRSRSQFHAHIVGATSQLGTGSTVIESVDVSRGGVDQTSV